MQVHQVGALHGAEFTKVVTIVRGTDAFTIPRDELSALQVLLRELRGPAPVVAPSVATERTAATRPPPVPAASTAASPLPELWDVIKSVLAVHEKAVGEAILVKAATSAGYSGENLRTRVRMVLTRRGKLGQVETTEKGRHRLVRE